MVTRILRQTRTTRTIRLHAFGGTDGLCLDGVIPPEPRAEEVLVRVHAFGVNPFDWKTSEGQFGPLPMPRKSGCDFSGVVEALGSGVADFFVGQSVFGYSSFGGAFAELMAVLVGSLAAKPPSLDDVQAAATPLCGLTAWQALFELADLQPGH